MKVDVGAVEAELARMQRELTNSEVRTSLFNLVVMSPDAQRAMVDEALNYLLGKRAARVIHIVNNDQKESSLEVSARCFVDHEHKGVCFQEVVITNGADDAGGAPGSWIPLLVRDIPTYILWLDRVSGREALFEHVQSQADKIIVDSDHCVELGDDPGDLLATLRTVAVEEGVPLADFSWKRLRPYQQLTAGAFDGEGRERWLDEIDRVELRGLATVAANLFALWLAERLGWSRSGTTADHERIVFRDVRGRSVEVVCENGEPGCDVAIAIHLTNDRVVEVTAGRNGCADVDYPGGETKHLVTIPSNGEILLEEVDAVYADDLYRDALTRTT
ncbi:MAG TPA: glucose-6-phosphate dehydrogenase assembly protein OpcA [Spirochaetia bacterium]|nr:glucose-6-phosphate dehydrogenase assembly protein OpcA [Spirochaetia bacterium]